MFLPRYAYVGVICMGISTEALMTLPKKNNIRPSYTRIKIMEYLTTRKSHPTADEIYSRCCPKNTYPFKNYCIQLKLNTFAKARTGKGISHRRDKELRFDADTSDHGRFWVRCKCGRIFDFCRADLAGLHLVSITRL